MVNVIIADDENKIRVGLKKLIHWKELGLNLICECSDGDELLKQTLAMKPNIIITDMRMPGASGKELLSALRKCDEKVKILVLSGFDDFTLVHQALRSKVVDYLLKPVDAQELNAILKKMAEEYQQETIDGLQARKNAQETYLDNFLQGMQDSRESFLHQSGIVSTSNQQFCMAVITAYSQDGYLYLEYLQPLKKMLIDLLGEYGCICIKKQRVDHLAVALTFSSLDQVKDFLENVYRLCEKNSEIRLAIGVGSPCEDHLNLLASYQEAIIAQQNVAIGEMDRAVYYIEYPDVPKTILSYEESKYLLGIAAENCNLKQFRNGIVEFYKNLQEHPEMTLIQLQKLNHQIINFIEVLFEKLDTYSQWDSRLCKVRDELGEIISPSTNCGVILNLIDNIPISFSVSQGRRKEIANKIRDYIKQRYQEKISLQDLADYFYLTKGYISKLFKQEFSIGVFDYIDSLRIEKAKQLLQAGFTVQEVVDQVGYYDESHLNRKFKKYVGMAPKNYKG